MAALLFALPADAAKIALDEICDQRTVLTQLGVDTGSKRILFSLPSDEPRIPGWWIELSTVRLRARLLPDPSPGNRSGASNGPGPFLSTRNCGPDCVQPLRWSGNDWEALGEPLQHARGGIYALGWSKAETPWLLILRPPDGIGGGADGPMASAFRLEAGSWHERGHQTLAAVGAPVVYAHPLRRGAVIAGSIAFGGDTTARPWVPRLPVLDESEEAQLLPVGSDGAALLSDRGRVSLSTDRGASWRRSAWTPWERTGGYGSDYRYEVPLMLNDDRLPVVWSRRGEIPARIWLTEWEPGHGWRSEAPLPGVLEHEGAAVPVNHIVWRGPRSWLLVAGCVARRPQAALLVRTLETGEVGDSRLVPLEPGW